MVIISCGSHFTPTNVARRSSLEAIKTTEVEKGGWEEHQKVANFCSSRVLLCLLFLCLTLCFTVKEGPDNESAKLVAVAPNLQKLLFTLLFPIILSPILIVYPTPEAKGAYTLFLMAGYWITECISIYVTAMLPLLMGPLMGIIASKAACGAYMRDAIMLFIHGAFLAVAAEHRNIHRRIGAAVIRIMGGDPRLLLLGLMLPTWFLSMWMSNAAATIMMLTIVEALMSRLEALKPSVDESVALSDDSVTIEFGDVDDEDDFQKLGCCFTLSIAFAAACGGVATVIGTPTNVVLFGLVNDRYGTDTGLTFGSWAAYGMPLSLILLICVWAILGIIFIGPKKFFSCRGRDKSREVAIRQILEEEKRALGPVGWADGSAMAILGLVILLWISRKPGVDGWSAIVPFKIGPNGKRIELTTDTQPALLGTILVCFWPAHNPFRKRRPDEPSVDPFETVLPWKVAQSRCPWQVLFLIGGGFCLSEICNLSGLSTLVGQYMLGLKSLPLFVLILVFSLLSTVMTTFVANAATATVLLPIMFQLSEALKIHPLYLGLPVTIAASMAFILPAGTPTNAIAYSKGRININQMIFAGSFVAVAGILVVTCSTVTYGVPIFNLNVFPDWAVRDVVNATTGLVTSTTPLPTPSP
ncbi:Solute carrier family 13 member 2 [Taenia crassiceps]|uniref:Solute carrier family 13 member 2 n=1 Tax=Taenia crassiceps TaxID=6207 RepID=A0ABR4Q5R2_9CEST